MVQADEPGKMRLDKWLWHTRFFKTRSLAAKICQAGQVRVNGTLTKKAHYQISPGDTLTFAQRDQIRIIKITELLPRRGSAPMAQACYEDLAPPSAETRLPTDRTPGGKPAGISPGSRPNKQARRALTKLRGKD
ncbi:MAG: RNA-binding S4 domain-containing protein [Pseudomonadota bacterium]